MASAWLVAVTATANAVVLLVLCVGVSPLHGATIVTSGDISAAATNPGAADLGDASISIGDFTIASTGTNLGSSNGNLAYSSFSNTKFIGVVGGGAGGFVESTEEVTLSFINPVSVGSLTIGAHGQNDNEVIISGFLSDPGASVAGLPSGWSVSFADGSVMIDSNGESGFLTAYTVNFANTVNVTSLGITAPSVVTNANGVGFVDITYVPEPSAALLGGLGLLCLLRRRRKDRSANGTSASVGRAGRIMRSSRRS